MPSVLSGTYAPGRSLTIGPLLRRRADSAEQITLKESTRTRFPCYSVDIYADPHGQDGMDAMEERLKNNTRSPVPDQAAFRIDYPAWLCQLGARNREIAKDMTLNLGTLELANRHKMSPGRISQLRREFQLD